MNKDGNEEEGNENNDKERNKDNEEETNSKSTKKKYDYMTKVNYMFREARFFLMKSNNEENKGRQITSCYYAEFSLQHI